MRFFNFLFAYLLTSFVTVAFAQEGSDVISSGDFFELLLQSLGGIKGASTLAIVGIVVKLILAFFNSELVGKVFKNLKGSLKILIVTGLSLVGGVVSLMTVNGLDFAAALLHSTTLSAFLVFGNQLYKQFVEKDKEEEPKNG